jgi:uncharacterized protein DUF3810
LSAPAARPRRWPLALLPAALVLQWLAGMVPGVVESAYARGAYRLIRRLHAVLTGWIPFSVAETAIDLFLGAVVLYAVTELRWSALRRFWAREGRGARLLRLGRGLVGVLYLTFLLAWGRNYRRPPLATLAGLGQAGGTPAELQALSAELIAGANALRGGVLEDAQGVMRLPAGRRAALDAAHEGLRRASARLVPLQGPRVRPKPALFSPVLSRLGIAGIFVPYTGEAHVNASLPDVDIPFAASHELAHERGLAREDEANYAAAVACRDHPAAEFRYSGALISSTYVQAALASVDRPAAVALEGSRSAGTRRDLRAMAEWAKRYRSRLTDVSERVNDTYLRSQGQPLGVRSYGAMVDLLLAERRLARPLAQVAP